MAGGRDSERVVMAVVVMGLREGGKGGVVVGKGGGIA